MVHRKTSKYSPIIKSLSLFAIILAILMITIGAVIGIGIKSLQDDKPEIPEPIPEETEEISEPIPEYQEIDFQTSIDEWTASLPGSSSVLIYDLDNDNIVSEHNPDDIYNTASLYKLFVAYEGYRRLQDQTMQPDSPADSANHTILECLDLMIRESNSVCAETIKNQIGTDILNQIIIDEYGIEGIDLSSLTSNPRAILEIMKLFYYHPDINDQKYLAQINDSFLNQPKTVYDWRQGLPSGFKTAKVYNKVGWDYNPAGFWNVYHDAAIIEFPAQNRHYIVVVMTNNVPFEKISELGSTIENLILSTY